MKFPASFLDEIRARVPVSQVVGRVVQWDRKRSKPGRGDWWACCPFHHEKTPSFHADDRKGFYYCFSCHAKGDIFTFLTEKQGLSFAEAVEQLAAEAGLPVPQPDPAMQQRERQRATLAEVMEMAARFYEEQLAGPAGHGAREYVSSRGLSEETIRRFRIGFAPDARDALLRHLEKADVPRQLMIDAGLVAVPEDGRSAYDRFRNRLMFPIRDMRGRVIAFGGRALGDARAKYLNSPETELFHKSRVLYNIDQARKAAFDSASVIAVEGYMDVIALVQAGFENVVAPLGTALTEEHLAMLWRMAPEPLLCFDGDAAGISAAWRTLELALPRLAPGHSLRFVLLPEGMDPDDLVRQEGAEAFAALVESAMPLIDLMWKHVLETSPRRTPEERAQLEARLEELAGRIGDERVRGHYRSEIRARLRELWRPAMPSGPDRGRVPGGRGSRFARGVPGRAGRVADVTSRLVSLSRGLSATAVHEKELVRIVLRQPEILDRVAEELAELEFSSRELDSLRRKIIDIAAGHAELDSARLHAHLKEAGAGEIVRKLAGTSTTGRHTSLPDLDIAHALESFAERVAILRRTAVLERDLRAAEKAFELEPTEENFARINRIREELHAATDAGN